jgi:hypothetical protein
MVRTVNGLSEVMIEVEGGFMDASRAELQRLDYLLSNRDLNRDDLESIDRWIMGYNNFTASYIISWVAKRKIMPIRSGLLP